MLDLIIKNGSCFIEGKPKKIDIGVLKGKISIIGELSKEKSNNIFDAKYQQAHEYSTMGRSFNFGLKKVY